ncbi:MAG: choline dehydrogenase-like flavoprotein [Bradymonadia bacterium]|jgi:choline dehydrogenase-like flavoprotein
MRQFARDLDPRTVLNADVCVIGAGAAGITIAKTLAEKGRSVLLLEGGGFEREDASQRLYDGTYDGTLVKQKWPEYLGWSRLRFFGGATNHWAGWTRPLDAIDFETRDWIAESGWPIDAAVMRPWYIEASRWIEISRFASLGGPSLTTPGLLPAAAPFRDALYYFSPPTRFGTKYRAALVDSPKVQVVLGANVLGLVTNTSGAVDHVRVKPFGRPEIKARAKRYVLACGGIENPRILMHSGNVEQGGLGNSTDKVGRYFMDHPHLTAGTAVMGKGLKALSKYRKRRVPGCSHAVRPVFTLTDAAMRAERLPNVSLSVRSRKQRPKASVDMRQLQALTTPRKRGRDVYLFARFEQRPNPASRVTLTDDTDALGMRRAHLSWRLTDADRDGMHRTMRLFGRTLGQHGLGRLNTRILSDKLPGGAGGCHHMGTTRMSARPADGVVDADCRVHACPNLFIGGSSVFPTGGYANPTFTLVALALRLAAQLHTELA